MAIQDDWAVDVVNKILSYTGGFTGNNPTSIYTLNALYSYLQDLFDEPGFMQYEIPMTAQTPTQYSLVNLWFIDPVSVKGLYGGSLQSTNWTHTGSVGITAVRMASFTIEPDSSDVGKAMTGTSGATGILLYVDTSPSKESGTNQRDVIWLRNTNATQFGVADVIDDDTSGINPDFTTETNSPVQSGENIWVNLFSVGSKTATTEIYVGQDDDYMGGRSFHAGAIAGIEQLDRRTEKIDAWWDTDVDFATGSPNLLGGVDHFDILMLTQEAGRLIDGGRLFCGARQFGTVSSHFELVAASAGNFVVPFASAGADLNSNEGPYNSTFTGRSGNDLEVGDILENDSDQTLRAVVTAVVGGGSATGDFDYYLIGVSEPLATTDRTLDQLTAVALDVRGDDTTFTVGTVTEVANGPAQSQSATWAYANTQVDVDEDSNDEEYALTIDCNSIALQDVWQHGQFLSCRGNQDGSTADTQDTTLVFTGIDDEAGEFYRAVGDVTMAWDTNVGTLIQEGELITNSTDGSSWTASGWVVAFSGTTSGQVTLTNVKGTFSDGDVLAVLTEHASNSVAIDGAVSTITDITAAPFGVFAGGKWFCARGVVLINVPAADANNWETIDLGGTRRAPPAQRIITFAGLVANDRAILLEVGTAGGTNYVKTHNAWDSGGALDASTFVITAAAALDVPTTGWVRHVDDSASSTGDEYRYEYNSLGSGATPTITLNTVSPGDDVVDSGSTTTLTDTGIGTSFGTDGFAKVGHQIRNTTTGDVATILRAISANELETTAVSSGWNASDGYSINTIVVAMAASDTVYWPYIDDTATGTSLTTTVKYSGGDTDLIARTRFSDPDVGGTRILPDVQKNLTLLDADLTITAKRTADTIATA